MNNTIEMVDLKGQYLHIKSEIDEALQSAIDSANFINGPEVKKFEKNLATHLNVKHVIACANGTDALQIALMALELNRGDEVIVPCFTYAATAEVIGLLGLTPLFVEVDESTFNISLDGLENIVSSKTKAIVPVHLYGQCSNMEEVMNFASKHNLYVVEDTAQAIGAEYKINGSVKRAGTIGDIGTTSFFPSKNLGCYGDGGAVFTNDDYLATKIRMIANHGQAKKYFHEVIGMNSRLDTLQAVILDVKLKRLNEYQSARQIVAAIYDDILKNLSSVVIPFRDEKSTHVFHQYTLKIKNDKRDELKMYLSEKGIPSMIYYPMPLHFQQAFKQDRYTKGDFPISERLCEEVLSLPIHTEMEKEQAMYIANTVVAFFNN